eukprot:COSAG01_NODE_20110_length_970_cov_0.901263_1_plen_65_part_10
MGHPSGVYLTLFPGDRQRLDPKRMRLELGVNIRHVEPGEQFISPYKSHARIGMLPKKDDKTVGM